MHTGYGVGWEPMFRHAVAMFLEQMVPPEVIDKSHLTATPQRVAESWKEYIRGCSVDPASYLKTKFTEQTHDQMIRVEQIQIRSICAHHFAPIVGKGHFAYLPDKAIVGLSKIPRMIDALARRPQVQENLTDQIVDLFQDTVKPMGCAFHIRAFHFCMLFRGVEEPMAFTSTTALRGCFKGNPETRREFLDGIDYQAPIFP
jgi:GTP cyclohydrolase I